MKAIHDILRFAVQNRASDVHLTINSLPAYRAHGKLQTIGSSLLTAEETYAMAKSITTDEQFEQFLELGDLDISYILEDTGRFRVNLFKQRGAIAIVLRIINPTPPSLEQLQVPPILQRLVQQQQGLILVTGPTGSGKSTTLAAMIDYINTHFQKHIITLEDPIEYIHEHKQGIVNQREVGQDCESFAKGLRSALRQDPDVILVGEMRDLETIHTALTAAETGHLVLATLHTSSAAQTIDRIIDVFPAIQQQQIRTQLSSVLTAVISQRLLPTADEMGRVAALEILVNTTGIANLIRSDKIHQIKSLIETGRSNGMQSMEHATAQLVQSGMVAPHTANELVPDWNRLS